MNTKESGKLWDRDGAVELLRVLLVFGICLLHSFGQSAVKCRMGEQVLLWVVDAFVFISGWYGIRFSWQKCIRLLLLGAYTTVLSGSLLSYYMRTPLIPVLRMIWSDIWFLHGYLFLMLFSPALNFVVSHVTRKDATGVFIPFFVLFFGWGFGLRIPYVGKVCGQIAGLTDFSGLTLVCVYVFAALCRRARVEDRLSATCLWMIAFGCLVISSIGFGFYLSPFAVGLAMSVFFLFKRVTIRSSCGLNVLSLAGPSLFSVYLLHAHRPLFSLLPRFQEWLIGFGCPVWSTYLVIAGMVFLCGVIIDLPRRVVVGVLEGPINMLLGVADRAIAASAERMVRLVAD